jgi:hypothetical protein
LLKVTIIATLSWPNKVPDYSSPSLSTEIWAY